MNTHATGKPYTAAEGCRQIRSFVLREGRLTPSQERAMRELWPKYGVDYAGEPRALHTLFGRVAPCVLEIGFGNGDALLHAAIADPLRNYIGIEVHAPGVGRALAGSEHAHLHNVRIYRHDALEVLRNEIAVGELDEVRIYFPDPWHKKRHHKRRLVNAETCALIADRLRSGGLLHLATDWQPYAEQMWDVLDAQPALRNRAGARGAVPRPEWRPLTRFEHRGIKLGHGVFDLLYQRL
ncbi:MAG TPA: tRNA (guanosine(46)-N7)-methyltransferase TrmB [Xanthomonadaceae bacterium]|jgi:tRNA (guanine-N7-)-methyltransferase|nr:tRNA (guanosine(46)-N7)-methyltransferase TrmB [Xanthomonadaceae bacterium]